MTDKNDKPSVTHPHDTKAPPHSRSLSLHPTTATTPQEDASAVLLGLTTLDSEIRRAQGGQPGSGIYTLLDMLAGQFLGIPRGGYPEAPGDPATMAPVNVDVPYVSPPGPVAVGDTLSCTMGNWQGEPTAYAYEWRAEPDTVLAQGPDNHYLTLATDAGHTIVCVVSATNAAGTTAAIPSNAVAVEP